MRYLTYILLFLLPRSYDSNFPDYGCRPDNSCLPDYGSRPYSPPYEAKLVCRNHTNSCRFHCSHHLEISIKGAVVTWSGGSVDVSMNCRIRNTDSRRVDTIDYNRFLMGCSNGILIEQEIRKDADKNVADAGNAGRDGSAGSAGPGISTIAPLASRDTVLHFYSQGRYSRSAAIQAFSNERFFFRYSTGIIDTLASAATGANVASR